MRRNIIILYYYVRLRNVVKFYDLSKYEFGKSIYNFFFFFTHNNIVDIMGGRGPSEYLSPCSEIQVKSDKINIFWINKLYVDTLYTYNNTCNNAKCNFYNVFEVGNCLNIVFINCCKNIWVRRAPYLWFLRNYSKGIF
jgi:hypothetical protein